MRTIPLALNSLCAAFCIMIAAQNTHAQMLLPANDVPRTISYQGLLTNTDGEPLLDGEYSITLSLYADPTGTVKLWQETYTTPVTGGVFNLYLGSGNTPLPDAATMNKPLWIGIGLEGSDPMSSLTPLSASPYALNVPDRAITTAKLADGAVTADKVDMDYIGGILVNGEPVTAKGSLLNLEGSEDIALSYNDETKTLRLSRPTPVTRGDGEKGMSTLTGTANVWSMSGDGWNGSPVAPAPGDWIGTDVYSPEVPFEIRVNNERIMLYQSNGASTPNVVGGNVNNSISSGSIGSIIAGGGNGSYWNTIDNNADHAVIGGGSGNTVSADHGTISGGLENVATGINSTIGGGYDHRAMGGYATIGGGYNDSATALYATVSGGRQNLASDTGTFVGGGNANKITPGTNYSTIGGGFSNQITVIDEEVNYAFLGGGNDNSISGYAAVIGGGEENTASNLYAIVGGGEHNTASNLYSFIGGGLQNNTPGHSAAIVGGQTNLASGNAAFVGAGHSDTASGGFSVVTGGRFNVATHDYSIVGGGVHNSAINDYAFIGGGDSNIASGRYSTVVGGYDHIASGSYSTVGGGDSNIASGSYSTATGGYRNNVSGSYATVSGGGYHVVTGNYSTVGGGAGNNTTSSYGTIGGGELNSAGNYATVGGGSNNTTTGSYATISGGELNSAGSYAVIGGGDSHIASALNSTISGGWDHTASGTFSAIGGGRRNLATGNLSVIPGGDSLQTTSYAQTAIGFYNAPRGALTARPTAAAILLNNSPLFMVGNGGSGGAVTRTNAFEVSYNGHSVVYDVNGASTVVGSRIPFRGATYVDNVIYAWGSVGAAGGTFGVTNILAGPVGTTTITIGLLDPVTGGPIILTNAAITATLVGPAVGEFGCGTIRVSAIGVPGPNQFQVYTYGANCTAQDIPFMFHLTGRP